MNLTEAMNGGKLKQRAEQCVFYVHHHLGRNGAREGYAMAFELGGSVRMLIDDVASHEATDFGMYESQLPDDDGLWMWTGVVKFYEDGEVELKSHSWRRLTVGELEALSTGKDITTEDNIILTSKV